MKSPNILRRIPSVPELLESPPLKGMVERVSHNVVVDAARAFLDDLRLEVNKATDLNIPPVGELAERIARRILQSERPKLQPVINATGILLHAGLGSVPLCQPAIDELVSVAGDYVSLEVDLESGRRSKRMAAVESLLCARTGAAAALVVNNNTGATLLALAALAAGREVIVSRGQLVEIGTSYRLPDLIDASGAILREVGTTNKTHLDDYARAISDRTAALMRVSAGNYRLVGSTAEVSLAELVRLARQHDLPLIDDLGGGALIELDQFGGHQQPTVQSQIAAGADLVLHSGDKLLGGPQCGIVVGRRDLVERMARHPLARALRVDKLTLAALAATVRLYRNEKRATSDVPLMQLLSTSVDNLKNRAERLAPQLTACAVVESATPRQDTTPLGDVFLPIHEIPTYCIEIKPAGRTIDELARSLRLGNPAVVPRTDHDRLLLDLRSVFPRQDQQLVEAFQTIGG